MAEQPQQHRWTQGELAGILEMSVISDLERLIADPGRKYRPEFARDSAIAALRNVAESEVLPDDIRVLLLRVLTLYETASDPFLGMNLSTTEEQQSKPRVDIESTNAEERARQDWSNDE